MALAAATAALALGGRPSALGGAALFALALAGFIAASRGAAGHTARRVLLAAMALRLFTLPGFPAFSDDIYRYVHEGRASRISLATPFEVPPAELRPPPDDGISARVNHPEVPAAYPPFSQLTLLALVGLGDAVGRPFGPLRLAFLAADLLVLGLLFHRRRDDADTAPLASYGFHPLPLLEIGLGAHLDALGVGLVAAAVFVAWPRVLRGALVGLAMGVKPIAAAALLALPRSRRSWAALALGLLLGVGLPTLPYAIQKVSLHRGLVEYATRWEASPLGYALLEAAFTFPSRHQQEKQRWTHLVVGEGGWQVETAGQVRAQRGAPGADARRVLLDHRLIARGLAFGLWLIALGLCLRLARPSSRAAWAFASLWSLAPTLHPWYLLWMLPFAAAARSRALLGWAALAPLIYAGALGMEGDDAALLARVAMTCGLLGGAAWDVRQARRGSPGPGQAETAQK